MRLNQRNVIVLVALLLLASLAFILQQIDEVGNEQAAATPSTQRVFEGFTSDAVLTMRITDVVTAEPSDEGDDAAETEDPADITVVFERTDSADNWTLGEASTLTSDRPLLQSRLNEAVTTIVTTRTTDRFESDDLAQYGLETPNYIVEIETADETYTLTIGETNVAGTQYYAQIGDNPQVVLLQSASTIDRFLNLTQELPLEAEPTATPEPILNVPGVLYADTTTEAITSITVMGEDETLTLERESAAADWMLGEGSFELGDGALDQTRLTLVTTLFTQIDGIDELPATDLSALGLDDPQLEVIVEAERTRRLQLGDTDPTGTRYYALVDEFESVVVVPEEAVTFFFTLLEEPPIVLPEATEEATAEVTAEAERTPEATAEMTEEAGALREAEVTPEATEEAEATAEVTPEAEATAETTPEVEATEAVE